MEMILADPTTELCLVTAGDGERLGKIFIGIVSIAVTKERSEVSFRLVKPPNSARGHL
jgi:hypothetical protein